MRAVLDPNVIVSAALSAADAPAQIMRRWLEGDFELVVSSALLAELQRVLAYPKVARLLRPDDAAALVDLLESEAETIPDPGGNLPVEVDDPDDEYLVALAVACGAPLVSGDKHLRVLADRYPVFTPADFLIALDEATTGGSEAR